MLKILALGDSYTIGQGVRHAENWPMQLASRLRDRGLKVDTPFIIAATSWTTTDLLSVIARSRIENEYDLVTLLIGANDQFQEFEESVYATGFRRLLDLAIIFAVGRPNRVIVLSIPDYSVTQFGKTYGSLNASEEIDHFNEINKKISEQMGVYYINITEVSRKSVTDSTLLASDGLHPSAKMYAEWVELVMPATLSALEP